MLRTRVLSAMLLAPLVLLLVYLGGVPWLLTVLLVAALGWREMAQILRRNGFVVYWVIGIVVVLGAVGEAYIRSRQLVHADLLRPLLAGLMILSLSRSLYDKGEHPTANWGTTLAGALYLGFMLGHFIALRERSDGFGWVLLALLLTWSVDTAAYFVGSALGRHKLCPRISPKKTWEGVIGGTVAGLVAAPLLAGWLVHLGPWAGVGLGLLVAVAAPFGDLTMSLFKRGAQIKDSSHLIPGHGGILDRADSLLFTFPVVTYFALFVVGSG